MKIQNTFHSGNRRSAFHIVLMFLALSTLYFGTATNARAAVSTCSNVGNKPWPNGNESYDIEMDRVKYLGPINSTSTDSRASKENGQYQINLRGWLYYKRSASGEVKNAKVLIYNHGHNDGRGEPCAIVKYFVDAGYVVFAPLRRGHFANASTKDGWEPLVSTGIHLDRYVALCMRTPSAAAGNDRPHLNRGSSDCRTDSLWGVYDENAIETDYIVRQRTDIRDQIKYIKERSAIGTGGIGKLANPDRIALLGHSFGGSAVIIANGHDYGQSATITVSPAEKSWGTQNPYWEIELGAAMLSQARPIYFLQPKNGLSLEPTKTLFGIAIDKKYRSQAAIFPPAPCSDLLSNGTCDESVDPEWEQAHETFIGDKNQVELWGPSAKNFMSRNSK